MNTQRRGLLWRSPTGLKYAGRGRANAEMDAGALLRITKDALAIGLEAQRLVREKGSDQCHQ